MWDASGINISMVEGDFGVGLPILIEGATLGANDSIMVKIKRKADGRLMLTKDFNSIQDNQIELILTEAETQQLRIGEYIYSLDWYQNGSFLCNVIPFGAFRVVDKA